MGSVNGRVAQLEKATFPAKPVTFAWVDWLRDHGTVVGAQLLGISYAREPSESAGDFQQRVMAAAPAEMITISWRIGFDA